MPDLLPHRWDLAPKEAIQLQKQLATRIRHEPLERPPRTIAAVDVSYNRGEDRLFAAAVLCDARTLAVLAVGEGEAMAPMPYVPGLLSFREIPAMLEAMRALPEAPDVVFCDGQGIAHPRRLGVASHLGLWVDRPTIGSGKSLLYGKYEEPGPEPGDSSPLLAGEEVIGLALRTKRRALPLIVSVGHRITLAEAASLLLGTTRGYRLPRPIQAAHDAANALRRARTGRGH